MVKRYYRIQPVGLSYNEMEDIFNKIDNNAVIDFPVFSCAYNTYMGMTIKNIHQFKEIYIKEISCQINDTRITLLRDKYYKIDDTLIFLGKIEKAVMKKLLKNIGANTMELPIIQEYILDNGDLIHEEYVYLFEYKGRIVSFFEK